MYLTNNEDKLPSHFESDFRAVFDWIISTVSFASTSINTLLCQKLLISNPIDDL